MEAFVDWLASYRDTSNPYWPLPGDYDQLSPDAQRQARLAVLNNQNTPLDLVIAWYLFRTIYLKGSEDCPFYKDGQVESPDFHYELIRDIGKYALNAWAAPRGSAKSTVVSLELPMLLALTRPFYDISLFFSTERMKQPRFDTLMMQFTENELILADFGELKPKRGAATWNHEYLQLTNGSSIAGSSIMGKVRGGRPRILILDDVENDPDSDSETSRLAVIEKFEVILFKKLLPMLKPGTQMAWIGTLIDRKSFLYRATLGDDTRFDFWNRVVLRAIAYDDYDKSKCHLLWPEMWSQEFLENQKERIGPSAFASEFCNEPVSAQDRLLVVDSRKNEYTVEGEFNWTQPLAHKGLIKWQERRWEEDGQGKRFYEEFEKPYHEVVRPMFRVLLFDYAQGLSSYHDYSCIAIVGFDTLGTMWILDLWLGRAKDDTLMRLIYEKGLIWRPRILGIEAVSIQMSFAEALQEYIQEQEAMRSEPWRARVFPVKYPAKESKPNRIASLEWRFQSGRIKYPAHLAHKWPWDQLYAQTADFTMDLALLTHDDAIDTIAMSKHVVKTKGSRFRRERGKPGLLERIRKRQPVVKGQPLLSGVPTAQLTDEMLDVLSANARKPVMNRTNRKIERRRPTLRRSKK